ncbi:amino acid permease [Candidatus Woesearchaeota archaeon]|nr:amino acid permease [Candidatus Woesearchaeota archaeon]
MQKKHFYAAIATLVGTIIGAGVLGIPYIIAKAGFLTGLVNLVVLGIAVLLLYLYLGEVVLRTRGNHQLTGYAEIYLGKFGKKLMVFAMVFGIYGALIAYLIGEGETLAALFSSSNHLLFSIIFFVIVSSIIYKGLKAIENSELLLATLVVIIIVFISVFTIPKINTANLAVFNPKAIFIPYGVILFALAGSIAIPEMKEELVNNKKILKKAIIIGALIPSIMYIVFSLVIVGAMGASTTEVATIGLAEILGQKVFMLGNIFAVLAMATSFLTLGLALKEMYHYDYHINEKISWLLTIIPPFVLFLALKKSFVGVIGLTGGIAMGLEGALIVLMYRKAKKLGARKPEYEMIKCSAIEYCLMLIFAAGIIYTMINFLGII